MGAAYQEKARSPGVVLVFTYGSYMDPDVLRRYGAPSVETGQRATVEGWRLAYTPHANMLPGEGSVEGILYDLPHAELERLYGPDGYVTTYKPVAVVASDQPALTFVEQAPESEPDAAYAASLRAIMEKVQLPRDYIEANCP